MTRNSSLFEAELAYRASIGQKRLSVADMTAAFAALGYTLDRRDDARSMARYLAPPSQNNRRFPCLTTGVMESDTGMSAWHYQARRDANFYAMQALRNEIFSVSRGAVFDV